jgi:hypothetical protein
MKQILKMGQRNSINSSVEKKRVQALSAERYGSIY